MTKKRVAHRSVYPKARNEGAKKKVTKKSPTSSDARRTQSLRIKKHIVPLKKRAMKPIIPKIPMKKNIPMHHSQGISPKKITTPPKQIPIQRHFSPPSIHPRNSETERILIENFVSLQKVMVNLSIKFDNLNNQISKLLNLFEISAKALAEKGIDTGGDKEMIKKIDSLLEQNKLIARGLTLMHENRGESMLSQQPIMQKIQPQTPPRIQEVPKTSAFPYPQQRAVEQNTMGNPQPPQSKFKFLPKS
ncbi:MAG: hypothetical protein ABIJ14_02175 [Nanoarchaeota archaeon]